MQGATRKQIPEQAGTIEAEEGVLKCSRALAKSNVRSTDIAFGDVTFAELAASLESAVNYIDVTKFTMGESFLK